MTSYNKRVDFDQHMTPQTKADEMQRMLEFNKQQIKYKKEREEQERVREKIYHEQMIESVRSMFLMH